MKISLIAAILFGIFVPLYAIGVKAGTTISSQAQLVYEISDKTFQLKSNKVEYIVDQLLDLDLSWLDSEYVNVTKDQKRAILTFKLTNTGNGEDSFLLYLNNALGGNFEVLNLKSFIDTNKNSRFDQLDTLQNITTLQADESCLIFVSSDIPNFETMTQNNLGKVFIKAISKLGGSGVAGKVHEIQNIKYFEAIDGIKGGIDIEEGIYILNTIGELSIEKSVTLNNQYAIQQATKGDIAVYTISIAIAKNEQVKDITISDEIPKYTEYINGSLKLNNQVLTDTLDNDEGYFDVVNNLIVVVLDRLIYPDIKNIEFSVKVK